MELQLKHLAPYLPYALKVNQYEEDVDRNIQSEMLGLSSNDAVKVSLPRFPGIETVYYKDIKPILRPLSDLDKVVTDGLSHRDWLIETYYSISIENQLNRIEEDLRWLNHCDYLVVSYLFENHFDVFGLIPKGLAVGINTI